MSDLCLQVDTFLDSHLRLNRLQMMAVFEERHISVHAMWCADDVIIVLSHLHVSEHVEHRVQKREDAF